MRRAQARRSGLRRRTTLTPDAEDAQPVDNPARWAGELSPRREPWQAIGEMAQLDQLGQTVLTFACA